MSKPVFTNYPGTGEVNNKLYSYSQAVKVGPFIKCSGQGGWDHDGVLKEGDFEAQLKLAFANVETNVKCAGGKGWGDVISVRSYHLDLEGQFDSFVECFKEWMPNHQPIWTCVGVTKLGIPGMLFEIEIEAYIP